MTTVLQLLSYTSAKREKVRWDKMSPDERRKEQEAAYRQQAYSNS